MFMKNGCQRGLFKVLLYKKSCLSFPPYRQVVFILSREIVKVLTSMPLNEGQFHTTSSGQGLQDIPAFIWVTISHLLQSTQISTGTFFPASTSPHQGPLPSKLLPGPECRTPYIRWKMTLSWLCDLFCHVAQKWHKMHPVSLKVSFLKKAGFCLL